MHFFLFFMILNIMQKIEIMVKITKRQKCTKNRKGMIRTQTLALVTP